MLARALQAVLAAAPDTGAARLYERLQGPKATGAPGAAADWLVRTLRST